MNKQLITVTDVNNNELVVNAIYVTHISRAPKKGNCVIMLANETYIQVSPEDADKFQVAWVGSLTH